MSQPGPQPDRDERLQATRKDGGGQPLPGSRTVLPSGTLTFLFTDIEGSTRLWERCPEAMRLALARHDALLRAVIERHHGYVFKTVGDAFCAAFPTAPDALNAALEAHLALLEQTWAETGPIRVRMGLHTGIAQERDNDYFGPTLNRVARLQGIGHGQQTLLSQATYELIDACPVGASLSDLGLHRLKDLAAPEHVWQLLHPSLPQAFPPLKSLDYLPTNLPEQLTSFIGREKEMAEIKALLDKTRLLTLAGSGGTGKTRLALQTAAEVLEQQPDGVWLVELASLSDPALVAQTVAGALAIREAPGEPITETLLSALKDKQMLLVLDNCEHLLDASARLVDALLRSCPKVSVLASSREALGIAGERAYRVPSLSAPDLKQVYTPDSVSKYESVRLFIDRAVAARSDFTVTSQNAPALASVCHRLDGIPLAIELAAARVRAMPLEQIEARLDSRFRLLTGGSRTALPRQQTLRALIDWSYDLLDDQERALLCRLSVFAGGWRLEAAETVCAGEGFEEWEVLDVLTSLVDKSLVVFEERGEKGWFRLLETVRQYARDRLVESGESDTIRGRHRDYFLALAEESEPKLTGAEQGEWFQRLEEEHENLRAALDWSLTEAESSECLRLCGALQRFWWKRGYLSEGWKWCLEALNKAGASDRTPERAKALYAAGTMAINLGDTASAQDLCVESLSIRMEIGDRPGMAGSLIGLGSVAARRGELPEARTRYEEGLQIFREIGERRGIAMALNNLGTVAADQGDKTATRGYYEEGLLLYREIGDRSGVAMALHNLGTAALEQGDYTAARAYFEEGLAIRREIGDEMGIADSLFGLGNVAFHQGDYASMRAYDAESLAIFDKIGDVAGIVYSLEAFAHLAAKENRPEQAAVLWGAAERLREEIGYPMPPADREPYDHAVAAARQALGEEPFSVAWGTGRTFNKEQAIARIQEALVTGQQ